MTPSANNPAAGTPAEAAPAAAVPAVDGAALQTRIDELKEQVAESNRTAQYWAEKAKTPAPAPAAAVEEEPDVLEALTTGGAKGFDELAKKRGFIQRGEVEKLIDQRTSEVTKQQDLMKRFPDLKDQGSDFFKATAIHYGVLYKAGTPGVVAMELAADRAELDLLRSGKIKPAGSGPTKEEKETERLARIAAQSGEGGGRRPAAGSEEDEGLTPEQKHIADAMGISHEAYAKRAKAGVSIKGR